MEPALHPQPWASIDPRDGSAITIVQSVDNQDGKFKSLEVICAEAVAKYKTCTTCEHFTRRVLVHCSWRGGLHRHVRNER